MAKILAYKCKKCGVVSPSPIQLDERSFADPTNQLVGNSYQCGACGQSASYNKPDHFFVERQS